MKKTFRFTIFLLFFSNFLIINVLAQQVQAPKVKFGEVSMVDVAMKIYPKDSSADAVVLFHKGETVYTYNESRGFMQTTFVHERIKILKKSGYNYANIKIPYYKGETITSLKGFTFNLENGQIVKEKLSNDNIFDEKLVGDELRTKKIAFPQVREGSVIDLTYADEFPSFSLDSWEFQREIPTAWSEYSVSIPDFLIFTLHSQGYEHFVINENKKDVMPHGLEEFGTAANFYHFAVQNAPSLKAEPFMTTIKDYESSIGFQLAGTAIRGRAYDNLAYSWNSLLGNVLENESLGGQLKSFGFIKDAAAELKPKIRLADTLETLKTTYNFVRKKLKWNEEKSIYVNLSLRSAVEKTEGNSAELNIYLVDLLNEIGYQAYPVLLSTRDHGALFEYYPTTKKLNYLIAAVKIGAKFMLLDATDRYTSLGILPERCLNGKGLLIDKKEKTYAWLKLLNNEKEMNFTNLEMTLSADGELSGNVSQAMASVSAANFRANFGKESQAKFIENYKIEHPAWEIKKTSINNLDDAEKMPEVVSDIIATDAVQVAGQQIYLKTVASGKVESNPFKNDTRKFPVSFAEPKEETYLANISLPKGYILETPPKPVVITLPENAGKFTQIVTPSEGKVQIMSRLAIKKMFFTNEEYFILREFYNQIIAKQNEQLVLKKN